MGFQIANDANGTPTLWEGSHWQARPVINRDDLSRASDPYGDLLFDLLTRVLAPDEATIERLAPAVHDAYLDTCERLGWPIKAENTVPYAELSDDSQELDRATVRAVLKAVQGG